ncbi:MAG TPA: hypothetical protein VGC91_04190 [Pyrinomonadaceae bacterium]
MKNSSRKILVFILALAFMLTCCWRLSYACGPFSRYAIFSFSKHPDLPLDKFSDGALGVLQPSYARSYLYVSYRLMTGGRFNQAEQQALSEMWNARLDYSQENGGEDTVALWQAARKKVAGITTDAEIEVFRDSGKDDYSQFLNCTPDAFRNATKTLEERIAKFGAGGAEVKEWTLAQDQVFANCARGQTIPATASSSSQLIQYDRAYQIAAAHFYAMEYDEARNHFEKIASDTASPWHEQAEYLVARALIRKASLGAEASRQESFAHAEAQLRKVVSDTSQSALKLSAQNLLNLIKLRLHPAEQARELSQALLRSEANANLKQELWDYTILLDRYLGDSDEPVDENLKKALDASEKDDLTDWLINFQAEPKDSLEHAMEKWQRTNSLPWLIAALSKVDASDAKTASLVSAAERIEPSSPAYATAQYHLMRLAIKKGDRAGARRQLDSLLQAQTNIPASASNLFRHQRMLLAASLDDFLKYAQRQPAAYSWDDDGRETPIELKDDEELKGWSGRALLDEDAVKILNEQFPLALLREAATNGSLPEHLRKQLALAAWTRAAILDDVENGKALAPVASTLAPELKTNLDAYLAATTPANRKSAALYTILKFPGLEPYMDSNIGRLTPLGERDIYRDNWWCDLSPVKSADEAAAGLSDDSTKKLLPTEAVELEFFSGAQRAAATRERAQLLAQGAAPNYLAREAIAWANRTPNDPRVPEALHIAITATRYGCSNEETGKWSKAAFDLLHKRYPQSPWAKKTPYWFNG